MQGKYEFHNYFISRKFEEKNVQLQPQGKSGLIILVN